MKWTTLAHVNRSVQCSGTMHVNRVMLKSLMIALCFAGGWFASPAVWSQTAKDDDSNLPDLAKPPVISAWPENARLQVKKAFETYRTDPVSACLTCVDLLAREQMSNADQKAWLTKSSQVLLPVALDLLKRDYAAAIASEDVRAAMIAFDVQTKLEKTQAVTTTGTPSRSARRSSAPTAQSNVKEAEPVETIIDAAQRVSELAAMLESSFQGNSKSPPVWKLTAAKATRMPSYTERTGTGTLNVSPKEGHEYVELMATVQSISSTSDPIYVGCCLPPELRAVFQAHDEQWRKTNRTRRLACRHHLYLKTSAGFFPCKFVCKDSKKLNGPSRIDNAQLLLRGITNNGPTDYAGEYVEKNKQFPIHVLFDVPKGTTGLELVFLGSAAVEVDESDAAKPKRKSR